MSDIAASLASLATLSESVSSMSLAMASMSSGMNEILTAMASIQPKTVNLKMNMDMSGMSGMDMSGMSGMDMSGMSGMDMSGMSGMDMSGMSGMDMSGMSGMDMSGMDMSGMTMSGMTMSGMSMSGMDMTMTMSGMTMTMDHNTMDHGDHTMDHGDHTMNHSTMTGMTMTGTAMPHGSAGSDMDMDMDMDHGHGHGMDMGGCKVSMMWNWNTIDACFLSSHWHVTSRGMFAGTCIGVFAWVLALEVLRRLMREFDRYIVRSRKVPTPTTIVTGKDHPDSLSSTHGPGAALGAIFSSGFIRPYLWQQVIRAALRTIEFGAAFLLMLMGMYYNGYILITIWISMFIASFILSGDTVPAANTELNCHC